MYRFPRQNEITAENITEANCLGGHSNLLLSRSRCLTLRRGTFQKGSKTVTTSSSIKIGVVLGSATSALFPAFPYKTIQYKSCCFFETFPFETAPKVHVCIILGYGYTACIVLLSVPCFLFPFCMPQTQK